jgi:predicted NBD/HSP70 family sugar kinase
MADCDGLESARYALEAGSDWVGTTLAGYTPARSATAGPDLDLLRDLIKLAPGQVIAEGRFSEPWEAQAAMAMGATAVVIGGALNDPTKQTRRFATALAPARGLVGAVDIGGTWLRFAVVDSNRQIQEIEMIPLLSDPEQRLSWIQEKAHAHGIDRLGIGTGGTVDPRTRTVTEAKPIIPDHVGSCFELEGIQTVALNDGLATAWGHGCHPSFAGKRVATLALGTGVGCGLVDRGRIWMGPGGQYPRINDLPSSLGGTIEDHLGGLVLGAEASAEQRQRAQIAAGEALNVIRNVFHPDEVVVCGGVGLADWLHLPGTVASPFGSEAGLIGAASLALFPPLQID